MPPEIPKSQILAEKVFSISNDEHFLRIALEVYQFQYHNNLLYRQFSDALRRNPLNVHVLDAIPFLPISFFKTHQVMTTRFDPVLVFESSGTTGMERSRHFLKDTSLYSKSFRQCFQLFFGRPSDYCILGLLPSYLERKGSSLVYMVNDLVEASGHVNSGFYLDAYEKLYQTLTQLEAQRQKTLLFGVSYALLDFVEAFPLQLAYTTVVETGGMKGRKQEMAKPELYEILKKGFGLKVVYSEYGMTELLSQAYAVDGSYVAPPWMKLLIRDPTDPLQYLEEGRAGGINIIDLANIYSCSFIATDDAGRHSGNSVEVLGRMNNSDIRGCSLLVAG
jgi:phenylacetate-coenzyme A ligase PaaK-like adenylate-forming protein